MGKKVVTNKVKCVKGWLITMQAIKQLWPILRNEYDFQFLFTLRLNQDPLEYLFPVLRFKGGHCINPTTLSFARIFKQVSCNRLLKPVKNGNCEVNVTEILGAMCSSKSNILHPNISNAKSKKSSSSVSGQFVFTLKDIDINEMKCLNDNGLHYVCGYLVRKIKSWHKCKHFTNELINLNSYTKEYEMFTKLKRYSDNSGIINATPSFHYYVAKLEKKLINIYEDKCSEHFIFHKIVNELIQIEAPAVCKNFSLEKCETFFVRLRIYYLLKFNNQLISSKSKSKIVKQFTHA